MGTVMAAISNYHPPSIGDKIAEAAEWDIKRLDTRRRLIRPDIFLFIIGSLVIGEFISLIFLL